MLGKTLRGLAWGGGRVVKGVSKPLRVNDVDEVPKYYYKVKYRSNDKDGTEFNQYRYVGYYNPFENNMLPLEEKFEQNAESGEAFNDGYGPLLTVLFGMGVLSAFIMTHSTKARHRHSGGHFGLTRTGEVWMLNEPYLSFVY
jgi:hypothetical protein